MGTGQLAQHPDGLRTLTGEDKSEFGIGVDSHVLVAISEKKRKQVMSAYRFKCRPSRFNGSANNE
jgi:hypothetical protein